MDNIIEYFLPTYNRNKSEFESVCRTISGGMLDNLLLYLSNTDFYYSPAARSYHDNYPGGLYDHCKLVYRELIDLRSKMRKNWTDLELLIISFGHDLCKVGLYIPNVDSNGILTYSYNKEYNPDIHGTSSLSILADIIPDLINERVANSIVCHMGLWTKDIPNIGEFMMNAQSKDDLVFFTHSADMVASRIGRSSTSIKLEEFTSSGKGITII